MCQQQQAHVPLPARLPSSARLMCLKLPVLPHAGSVLYFTAASKAYGCECLGVATSSSPAGPYTPIGDQPIVCQSVIGGTIDPSPFTAGDGTMCAPDWVETSALTVVHVCSSKMP